MLGFIPAWIWGVILVLGVLGLVFRNKLSDMLGGVGSVVGLKKTTTLLVLVILAIFMGGVGVVTNFWSGLKPASITTANGQAVSLSDVGEMTLKIHDGLVNASTTDDTVDSSDKFMTFYAPDADIMEGEEIAFNITVGRSNIAEDTAIKVTCVLPDKDITASEDCIALKTAGEINLDFVGARDSGTHIDDNTVYTYVDFSEGTGSKNIKVKFDQDESFHDAMTDLQDYVDVTCTLTTADGQSDQVVARIYADS